MKHTDDQKEILKALNGNNNLFITGSAGAGKSYIIQKFYENTTKNVALCATTGIAALNLGGETVHRFLGLGIATRPEEIAKIVGKWRKIKTSKLPWDKQRWKIMASIDTIVIDEVSMLRRDQFELIDAVLSGIRENNLPFGGYQIVLVGDLLQLPPVVSDFDLEKYEDLQNPYCFQSDIWKFGKFHSYNLTCNYRQDEGNFLSALELIRKGQITDEIDSMLSARLNAKLNTDLKPVKLFPHKYKVEEENLTKLDELPDEKLMSKATLTGKEYDIGLLKKDCPAEEYLHYCKDAQIVMLTNNHEGFWVNGTLGIIKSTDPLIVKLSSGVEIEVEKYTWERSIHTLNGKELSTKVVAKLTQYPFKLSWATTIHRCQGITLDFVEVDLSNCFAAGQGYTALSRVKTLEGLTLTGWNKKSIMANKAVLDFYGFK